MPSPPATKQWKTTVVEEQVEEEDEQGAPTATAVSSRSTPWIGLITLELPSPKAAPKAMRPAVPLPPGEVPLELHTPGCTQSLVPRRRIIPNEDKCSQQ